MHQLHAQVIIACLVLLVITSSGGFGVNGTQIAQVNGLGYEIAINETHAFVTNNNGLAVYDIQDPTDPDRLAQFNLGGEARGVAVVRDILYIGALSQFILETTSVSLFYLADAKV